MTRTTISLPNELAERLRLEAERRGTSVSEVVRTLVSVGLGIGMGARRRLPFAAIVDSAALPPASALEERLGDWADAIDRDRG
jgi:hypothetical protein